MLVSMSRASTGVPSWSPSPARAVRSWGWATGMAVTTPVAVKVARKRVLKKRILAV
ncbi:hypothetical protein BDP81DRAFT_436413 [Colletotrichum phormii]|uniref:Uncharacterized protein n=1 Tax=Colletotrichum phormii TaxID=359342 RepID=A0AAI9ZIR7_9PEZI|nr:uncharacterized protein BDP81DRAFT_436413 [Colletotrichum phormii]KAK1625226.1 hypothetical protein BDP81DRAFT_436413 [Colletotrichum phormii]